jgi:cytochrome P450
VLWSEGDLLLIDGQDAITQATFSKRVGFLDTGTDSSCFAQTEADIHLASWAGQIPWLYRLLQFIEPGLGYNVHTRPVRNSKIPDFVDQQIAIRTTGEGSGRRDLLGKLLTIQSENALEIEATTIQSMANVNIFQGGEKIAVSLRTVFCQLLQKPECLQKLLAEIDSKWQTGYLSDPVRMEEAGKMPYLQAVLFEALRLRPAVGMGLPRIVPEGGVRIDGIWIPSGGSMLLLISKVGLLTCNLDCCKHKPLGPSQESRFVWKRRR